MIVRRVYLLLPILALSIGFMLVAATSPASVTQPVGMIVGVVVILQLAVTNTQDHRRRRKW